MWKACLALAFFCLVSALPVQAFNWETATSRGREYVSLRSFCLFYGFRYQIPNGNERFAASNGQHSISLKVGNSDMYLDGVHYVMSFPVESGDSDWLISRMDVIKLFEPILRPTEVANRHPIRGVVIDAGHGGGDNGATSRLGAEKNYTLKTAFLLEDLLRRAGLKTVLTRRTDVFVDLYERAHIASLYPDYCFVSIHFNSATEEARGLETYCLSPRGAASTSSLYLTRGDIQKLPGNDYDTQNILLASMVHSEIIHLNPGDATADRGVKRARFVVIKQNVLPAILVEGGFVSNHMEAARVDRDDYRQRLAQAIARGVIRFANVMGDDNYSLPGFSSTTSEDDEHAMRALPVTMPSAPSAPAGLARDAHLQRKSGASSVPVVATTTAGTAVPATSPATTTGHHKKKKGKTAASATSGTPTTVAPAPETATPTPSTEGTPAPTPPASTPSAPLNLAEPAAPTPTAGMDKAAPEPDEPPTVNIYPTPSSAPKSTPPAPEPSPAGTNAPAEHQP